jgi:hypothetical protein
MIFINNVFYKTIVFSLTPKFFLTMNTEGEKMISLTEDDEEKLNLLWDRFLETAVDFKTYRNEPNLNLDENHINKNLKIVSEFLNTLNSLYHVLMKCRDEDFYRRTEKFYRRNEKFLFLYNKTLLWSGEMEILDVAYQLIDVTLKNPKFVKKQVMDELKYPLKEVVFEQAYL